MTSMSFSEYEPVLELKRWVDCYWQFSIDLESGQVDHTVPPDGGMSLLFNQAKKQLALIGPFLTPLRPEVQAGDKFFGVRFWPGVATALLKINAEDLRNRVVPAFQFLDPAWVARLTKDLVKSSSSAQIVKALNHHLGTIAEEAEWLDSQVMEAVFRLIASQGQERIGAIAPRVGLSPRQLRRRFRAAVGLTPKELARLRRLRACLVESLDVTERWVSLALEHGYADQAHLIREAKSLIGVSPTSLESHLRTIDHRLLEKGEL